MFTVILHLNSLRYVVPAGVMMSCAPQYFAAFAGWRTVSILLPVRWFRAVDDAIYSTYQRMVDFFFEHYTGVEVILYGDAEECLAKQENVVYLSNHQTTLDWVITDMLALRAGCMGRVRYILKDGLKYLPLYGFAFGVFRGLDVSWQHVLRVYEWDLGKASSLRMLHRISDEHLNLTPTLRMKVKLAAQVLSSTMANALIVQEDASTESTRMFIQYMNLFFDCLNVARLHDGKRKRNLALYPYRDVNDWRFTWLQEAFLSFLDEWTTEADMLKIPRNEKEKLHLSWQTLAGMEITVKSFVALTRELLREGVPYILSEKFSQDPLEEYFAKQRGMGGGHDNPSVSQFGSNMLTIHVAGASIKASKRANVTTEGIPSGVDSTPIPRKRAKQLFKK